MIKTLFRLLLTTIFMVPFYIITTESSSDIEGNSDDCVTFDPEERVIIIDCKNTNLTEVDNQLSDRDVLRRDEDINKGWILNAGIMVGENAGLYINSSDTSWLKIIADEETAYPILISGGLKIDSVKVTSESKEKQLYYKSGF